MYEVLKGLHNILRWVVLAGGAYALALALKGLFTGAIWQKRDRVAGVIFTAALGAQLLVGLVLYVISPLTRAAMQDMGAAMQNDTLRFFAVEHFTAMIAAVVIAQIGYSVGKRAGSDRAKFLWNAAGYGIAMLLILSLIPWWRPLLPWYWG